MRGEQLARQWELLRLLLSHEGQGISVDDMCEALRAHRRTIYRDLEVLQLARFNLIRVTDGPYARYHIPVDNPVLPVTD